MACLIVSGKRKPARNQRGFAYLGVLFAVALVGVSLAATGTLWQLEQRRERERELLFVGHQFRSAVESYYRQTPGPIKAYPRRLDDLLRDTRYPNTVRHLRRLYRDPMTGEARWGLVRAADGGINGVYSLSDGAPIKVANFGARDHGFGGKAQYSDWRFIFIPGYMPGPRGTGASARLGESSR
jgi:type II secretory pathway pseudopilin PulG